MVSGDERGRGRGTDFEFGNDGGSATAVDERDVTKTGEDLFVERVQDLGMQGTRIRIRILRWE